MKFWPSRRGLAIAQMKYLGPCWRFPSLMLRRGGRGLGLKILSPSLIASGWRVIFCRRARERLEKRHVQDDQIGDNLANPGGRQTVSLANVDKDHIHQKQDNDDNRRYSV